MADLGMIVGLIKALAPKPDAATIEGAVSDWLDDHPEATTTVADGSITKAKLDSSLKGTVEDVDDLKDEIGDLSNLETTVKSDLVSAINEAAQSGGGGGGDVEIKDSTKSGVDLDISDPSGNVILRLKDGNIKTKNFDSTERAGGTCYVAPTGSDSNSGDSDHPFGTIQYAINGGYKNIILAPGEYKDQTVRIEDKHGLRIYCKTSTAESNPFESHQRQARAKLDNSIDIGELSAYNSIYRAALTVDTNSNFYKVFISHTVEPVYSGSAYYGRVTTYNAILWEVTNSILTCTRLVPKLTLVECEATAGTFYFDGEYIYINPTGGSISGKTYKRLNIDTSTSVTKGFFVYNSTDIIIEGVDVQFFPYYDLHAYLVSGLTMRDCGFYFTSYGSAAQFNWCNGDMWSCISAQAGADGFGIANGGNVSFFNCSAINCYDDGISHHDEATGVIDGGVWAYNYKGGITPSFGANVTVKNAVCRENLYGIYVTQSSGRVTDATLILQNCLAVDNTTKDILVTGYDVISFGCAYGTKQVDSDASLAEYGNTVI